MTSIRKLFRAGLVFALALVAAVCIAAPAYADGVDYAFKGFGADDLTPGKTGSIDLDYDNEKLTGVQVDLYRIADVSAEGFTFAREFKPYVTDIEWMKDGDQVSITSEWDVVAETLNSHALADGISPIQSGSTVAGKVSFANLPAGLYMVSAHSATIEGMVYSFNPTVVLLPTPAANGHGPTYEVKAEPKSTQRPSEPRTMKIVKHWVTNPGSDAVSTVTSISVQILRDGVAWGDPISLTDANQWSYSWEDTEGTHEWSASEQAINGSSVVWSRQVALGSDNVIVLTNTEVTEEPPPENPPGTPPSTPPSTPPTTQQKLPKTGEPWLPIPILLVAAFTVLGVSRAVRLKGTRSDHK